MTDPFHSPKRRLARVKSHIAQLERDINKVFVPDLLERVISQEFVGIQRMLVVKFRQSCDIPDELGDSAVEALDAIRSALDQACSRAAVILGASDPPGSAYFPFADTQDELEKVIKGRCRDLHPDLKDLLRSFEPYRDGNRLLWALNAIRRTNQHHVLAEVGVGSNAIMMGEVKIERGGPLGFAILNPGWNRERREIHAIHADPATEFSILNVGVRFYPALGDAGILTGEPVIAVLNQLASVAERIVVAMEAETLRLKNLNG